MTLCCEIECWVQRKNWPKVDFQLKLHTHYVFLLSEYTFTMFHLIFGLFEVRTCVSLQWHTLLRKKINFCLKKWREPVILTIFADFRVFWHDVTNDVTVTSCNVCLYFLWYQWIREGHSYPLVPYTWCFNYWG